MLLLFTIHLVVVNKCSYMRILRATIFNAGVGWVVGKGVVRAAKLPFSLTNDPRITVKSDEGSSVVKKIQDCGYV